jgi:hypothetical protein
VILLFAKYWGDRIKVDQMGVACGLNAGEEMHDFVGET